MPEKPKLDLRDASADEIRQAIATVIAAAPEAMQVNIESAPAGSGPSQVRIDVTYWS